MGSIAVDSVVEGRVTGIMKFGAFVDLGEKNVGLIHISQISNTYVTDVSQHLKVGDTVKVRVTGMTKDGKYDLSIKQLEKREEKKFDRPRSFERREPKKFSNSFEDKMTMFLKQSEEKLLDWKRNLQEKQEGKRPKKF
ncbi:MAG: S1 RNA-binding domain-containing protein [bacterium]